MKYNKLVRDNIPEIIEQNGSRVTVHIADKDEYKRKLYEKLHEEVEEFLQERSEEELADVMEVLDAIVKLHKLDMEKVKEIQEEKAVKRGRFHKKIILDETD